jgi:hypothetical protein
MRTAAMGPDRRHTARRSLRVIVGLSGGDIDDLAVSADVWEACLAGWDFGIEGEASSGALELVCDVKVSVGVGSWCAEWLPSASVVHEQLDDRASCGDWSLDGTPRHLPALLPSSPAEPRTQPRPGVVPKAGTTGVEPGLYPRMAVRSRSWSSPRRSANGRRWYEPHPSRDGLSRLRGVATSRRG